MACETRQHAIRDGSRKVSRLSDQGQRVAGYVTPTTFDFICRVIACNTRLAVMQDLTIDTDHHIYYRHSHKSFHFSLEETASILYGLLILKFTI